MSIPDPLETPDVGWDWQAEMAAGTIHRILHPTFGCVFLGLTAACFDRLGLGVGRPTPELTLKLMDLYGAILALRSVYPNDEDNQSIKDILMGRHDHRAMPTLFIHQREIFHEAIRQFIANESRSE